MDTVSTIKESVRRLEIFSVAAGGCVERLDNARIVRRSLRAAIRSVRQRDGMDCCRSSCSASDVNCEK